MITVYDEFENDLIRTTLTIRVIVKFANNNLFHIPHKLIKIMKKRVISFIHINCPEELHCQNRIIVP